MKADPGRRKQEPHRRRSRARRRALQALYQWQVGGQDLTAIEKQFLEEYRMGQTDTAYFTELLHRVPALVGTIDGQIDPYLDRPFATVDPVEKAILRIGVYELTEHLDIPYRVVINEAVELAKRFGAEQSHRYINGVLDKVGRANRFRAAEIRRGAGGPA